jgi:hypothetical protein
VIATGLLGSPGDTMGYDDSSDEDAERGASA